MKEDQFQTNDATIAMIHVIVAILKSVDEETQKEIAIVLLEKMRFFQSLPDQAERDIPGRPFAPDKVNDLLLDFLSLIDPSVLQPRRSPNEYGF